MPKITCRTRPDDAEWLAEHFGTRTAGGEFLLGAVPVLYRRTLHSLRGRFERGELMLLIDVMNGNMLAPGIAGHALAMECEDGVNLNQLDRKWEIGWPSFRAKIQDLSVFERFCLEIWGRGYWASGKWQEADGEKEWIESLTMEVANEGADR